MVERFFVYNIFMAAIQRMCGIFMVLILTVSLPSLYGQTIESVKPMAPGEHPSFEVATVKPSKPDDQNSGFHTDGRRIFIENETMNNLISFAYNVHAKQIVDAPGWFGSTRFDIEGVPDAEGQPSEVQQQEMLKKLLADRFNLKFHREQREMSRYTLTVTKGGPKITPTKSDPNALLDQTGSRDRSQESWRFTNNSMKDFSGFLQGYVLDRPVVDQTGLKGKFDFKLKWTRDGSLVTDPNAPPGFFTAVQEQIGLKVEPSKGDVEALVIDHAELPSSN